MGPEEELRDPEEEILSPRGEVFGARGSSEIGSKGGRSRIFINCPLPKSCMCFSLLLSGRISEILGSGGAPGTFEVPSVIPCFLICKIAVGLELAVGF